MSRSTPLEGVSRREFLGALGVASVATLGPEMMPPAGPASPHPARPAKRGLASADEYLFTPGLVYLGTATLGPCSRRVVEASMQAWYELETNPTAMGYGAGSVLAAAERTRQQAALLLGCSVEEVVITRSTTDGMNAIAQGMDLVAGDRVLTSDQEHEGGSMCWRYLSHRAGVGIDVVPIPPGENDGSAILRRLEATLTPRTRVISISHVLSSTGLRMPIAEIAALARSRGALCVVDGAQGAGGIATNVKALGCHAYATSGHKWLMGPKGTGVLYIAEEASGMIQPIQLEDGRSYYSESSGVGNLPGVVGLGVAIQRLLDQRLDVVEAHNLAIRNRLYDGLKGLGVGRVVSAPPGPLASQLVTFELPTGIDAATLRERLRNRHNAEVKVVPKRWLNGIRMSPHLFNTSDDADALMAALKTEIA